MQRLALPSTVIVLKKNTHTHTHTRVRARIKLLPEVSVFTLTR
jgi:hypothetical protein